MGTHLTSTANVVLQDRSLLCRGGAGSRFGGYIVHDARLLTILEVFCFKREKAEGFDSFKAAFSPERIATASLALQEIEGKLGEIGSGIQLSLAQDSILLNLPVHRGTIRVDLGRPSRATYQVLRALQLRINPERATDGVDISAEAFQEGVELLENLALIVPVRGHINWGHFRRSEPFCKNFGFSRGTPVDRYYLNKFISYKSQHVKGVTLEIGGKVSNRTSYGFSQATEYHALDLYPSPHNDIVGDAHDPQLMKADSVDSIICFNVLEHCARPWIVVDNMHRWLRKGGKAFCMVPNAQRIHELPRDFWRPLPSALVCMFEKFADTELKVYGNLITHTASYYGIASEELEPQELESDHPDYPVATCIIARK